MGLAGVNHHQALVLGERQVPPRGDMPDAKRLAPAQVAPTPAAEGEGKGIRGSPRKPPMDTTGRSKPPQAPSPLPRPKPSSGPLNLS